METMVNEEYKKLLLKLENVLTHVQLGVYAQDLKNVMKGIEVLGTRPVLSGRVQQFTDITTEMTKVYVRKDHDYSNSFDRSLDEFGLIASVVRIGDKMNRIKSLALKEAKVKDESIRDTLLDMANYAIMTVIWLDNQAKTCNV